MGDQQQGAIQQTQTQQVSETTQNQPTKPEASTQSQNQDAGSQTNQAEASTESTWSKDFGASLRESLQRKLGKDFGKPREEVKQPVELSQRIGGNQQPIQTHQQPVQAQQQVQQEVKPVEPPPQQAQVQQATHEPAMVKLPNGKSYSPEQVENMIEGFEYYHARMAQTQDLAKQIEAEKSRVESLKADPMVSVIQAISENPEALERVMDIFRELDEKGSQQFQQTQQQTALDNKFAEMQRNNERVAQELQQFKQNQWNEHVKATLNQVDSFITQKKQALANEGIQVSDDDLRRFSSDIQSRISANQIPFRQDVLINEFAKYIDYEASKYRRGIELGRQTHLQEKRNLPPPPPSGGNPPTFQTQPVKNKHGFSKGLAERLSESLRSQ